MRCDGARPLEADVHLADAALFEDTNHLRDVPVAAAHGIDGGVVGIAGELDEYLSRPEPDVRQRPRVEAGVSAVGQEHEGGAAALEREQTIGPIPPFGVVAAAVRRAGLEEARQQAAAADAERVAATGLGEIAVVAELATVEIDDRVARHHQRVRLRDVLEGERLEHVVVVREGHAGGAVVQPVVRHVERRILDALPGAIDPGLLQVVLEREVQLEVERVAIAADAPGVAGIDRLLDVRKENRGVRVEDLAVGEHVMRRTIEQRAGVLPVDGAIEEVEHESLHVLGGVDPQAIDADDLNQPLRARMRYPVAFSSTGSPASGLFRLNECIGDVLLARSRVEHANGPMSDVGIEPPVSRVGHVRNPAECRRRCPRAGSSDCPPRPGCG